MRVKIKKICSKNTNVNFPILYKEAKISENAKELC